MKMIVAALLLCTSVAHAEAKKPTWTYMVVDGVQCRTDGRKVECGVKVKMPAHNCTQVTKLLTVCTGV